MNQTKIIAVAGKGGVGKTSVAAVIVKELVERYPDKKILAIDADPAIGLSTALDIEVTKTIDDIRKEAVAATEQGKNAVVEILGNAEYSIQDAIVESNGFSFVAIGRPEAAGCYCKINTYLKDVIAKISEYYDFVVIDGEAGIEQINRRVMEKVTHLILITDQSKKGLDVIKTIKSVADDLVMYERIGAIANRLPSKEIGEKLNFDGIEPLTFIPIDTELATYDMSGENVFYLPETSPVCVGAKEALTKMGLI